MGPDPKRINVGCLVSSESQSWSTFRLPAVRGEYAGGQGNSTCSALSSRTSDVHLTLSLLVNLLVRQVRGAQGAVHLYSAVVTNQSPLLEPIHKRTGSATSGANHICQNPLTYLGNSSVLRAQLG